MPFDGNTYDPNLDYQRLSSLMGRVWSLMSDGRWRTLREIQQACGGSEAGISARLRDFRKEKFGAYRVEHRRLSRTLEHAGIWQYRLIVPVELPPVDVNKTLFENNAI